MSYKSWNPDCKVYVGNLQDNCLKSEVEGAFSKFGPLKNVWVARNPPGFAFVEFEDSRDAEDAVRALDGTRIGSSRVRVEMSHGRSRRRSSRRDDRDRGHGGGGRLQRDDLDLIYDEEVDNDSNHGASLPNLLEVTLNCIRILSSRCPLIPYDQFLFLRVRFSAVEGAPLFISSADL
ncbi:nucleic acid binding [Tyrophagus putrescentiae]|nr:nucleic acid binding [Tyrophagus putrescentiae]